MELLLNHLHNSWYRASQDPLVKVSQRIIQTNFLVSIAHLTLPTFVSIGNECEIRKDHLPRLLSLLYPALPSSPARNRQTTSKSPRISSMSSDERTVEDSLLSEPQELLDLLTSLSGVDNDELADALGQELEIALPWLRYPLDFPAPDPAVRQKIQTDKSHPAYRIEEINFLSTYLHISELLASSILTLASSQSSRHCRTPIETSIKIFHDLITTRLDCVKWVLAAPTAFVTADSMDLTTRVLDGAFNAVYDKTRFETSCAKLSVDGFTDSIFKQLSTLSSWISETLPTDKRLPETVQLASDVQVLRVQSCRSHQRALAKCLYEVGASGGLFKMDLIGLVKWLKAREELDGTTIMMIGAFLAAIQHNPDDRSPYDAFSTYPPMVREFVEDPACLQIVTTQIIVYQEWKQEWISRVLMLGWGLLVDKAYRHDRSGLQLGKWMDKGAESRIQEAIENDAFQYARVLLVPSLDVPGSLWPKAKKAERDRGVPVEMQDTWPQVEGEYQRDALRQVDSLVKDMISSFQLIKKLKNREEDKLKALDMARNVGADDDKTAGEGEVETRQDFVALVELVITVYRELPLDHDDKLWMDSKFLNLVGDAEGPAAKALLCRLLIAISSGSGGSYWLYSHLVKDSSDLNLDDMHTHFDWVASKKIPVARLASTAAAVSRGMEVNLLSDPEIAPEDAQCLAFYCEMLSLIVKWHPRLAGEINVNYKTLKRLWELTNRNIPAELSSAVLNTLTTFATSEVVTTLPALAEASLSALDMLNVLSRSKRAEATRPATGFAMSTDEANAAWLTSLEDHDAAANTSLNRIALIHLFSTLIDVSDPEDGYLTFVDLNQVTSVRRIRTKMTEYILDDVFPACLAMIQGGNANAGYPLLEAVLKFVARTTAGLDLESLLEPTRQNGLPSQSESDRLVSIQQHPGFLALRRVLGNETLREAVFTAARIRVAEGLPESVPSSLFTRISFRAIQVLRTVMARQSLFLEVVVPSLRRRYTVQDLPWTSGNLYPVDWHLAHQPQAITQIASYVSIDVADGLASETVAFLHDLGRSTHMRVPFLSGGKTIHGNILAYVFRDAANSNVILAGFVDRLERGNNETSAAVDILPSRLVADYDREIEASVPKRLQQNQIMDLLLENTSPERSEITFAHFLLGFLDSGSHGRGLVNALLRDGPQAGTILTDGKVCEVVQMIPRTCFHVVVDRLSDSLPTLDHGQDIRPVSMIADSPEFGYKCIRLLRQLVQSDVTAHITARYLRGQEDLIHRSLVFLPVTPAKTSTGENGVALYSNGSSLKCSANDMAYFLHYQTQVLELASLELHLLDSSASEAVNIMQALLQNAPALQPMRGILALTVLAGLDFEWSVNTSEANAAGFERIDFNAFRRNDSEGALVYAIGPLELAMRKEIERLDRKAPSPERTAVLEQSKQEILAYLQRENGSARIVNAVGLALSGWSTAVTAVLTKDPGDSEFPVTPAVTFELSSAAFVALLSPTMQIPSKAETITSVLLSLSGVLARPEEMERGSKRGGPPVDRLQMVLTYISQAIADGEISELARGLLYATLTNYLKLVRHYAKESGASKADADHWVEAVLQPIYVDLERLMGIIGRDALNGSVDWQLVSYTLLDEMMMAFESKLDAIVNSLARRGLVHNFMAAIRVADSSIQGVFAAEAVDTNPLFVLETQLGLLSRITKSTFGAETLIESGIFESFASCRFLGARPIESISGNSEQFLVASERYLRAFIPVMKLMVDIAGRAGDRGYKAAARFAREQSEILLPFFRLDEQAASLLSVEALEIIIRFLFVLADDERKLVKNSQSVLAAYESALRSTAVRFLSREDSGSQFEPINADEQSQAETLQHFEDCTRYQARIRSVIYSLQRSLLGYYVDCSSSNSADDLKPVIIAGGQLGYDRQATRGGVSYVTFQDLVATLNGSIGRYISMTNLHVNLTRLILEDASVLTDEEIDELAMLQDGAILMSTSHDFKRCLAQAHLTYRRSSAAMEARVALQSIEAILILLHRHVRFYNKLVAEQTSPSRKYQAPSAQKAVEQDIVLGWHTDVTETLDGLSSSLPDLLNIKMTEGVIPDQESREAYLRIMAEAVLRLRPAGNTN